LQDRVELPCRSNLHEHGELLIRGTVREHVANHLPLLVTELQPTGLRLLHHRRTVASKHHRVTHVVTCPFVPTSPPHPDPSRNSAIHSSQPITPTSAAPHARRLPPRRTRPCQRGDR